MHTTTLLVVGGGDKRAISPPLLSLLRRHGVADAESLDLLANLKINSIDNLQRTNVATLQRGGLRNISKLKKCIAEISSSAPPPRGTSLDGPRSSTGSSVTNGSNLPPSSQGMARYSRHTEAVDLNFPNQQARADAIRATQEARTLKFKVNLENERRRWQDTRLREEHRAQKRRMNKERKAQQKLKMERKRLLALERAEDKQDSQAAKVLNFNAQAEAEAEERRIMSKYHRDGSGTKTTTDRHGRARNLLGPKPGDRRR